MANLDKDKLYSKRFQAQQEENELIEKRNILEGKYGNLIDKNGKRGKKYRDDIAKIEKDIHDSKLKQWGIQRNIDKLETEQKKKKEAIERIGKNIVKDSKENRSISKSLLGILDSSKGKIFESFGIEAKTVRMRKEANDVLEKKLKDEKWLKDNSTEEIEAIEQQIKANNALSSIEKEMIEDAQNGTLQEMTLEDVKAKLKEKGVEFDKLSEESQEQVLKQMDRQVKASKQMDKDFQKGYESVSQMDDAFGDLIDKSEQWGAVLKNPQLRMAAMKTAAIGFAMSLAKDAFGAAKELRQELGLGAGQAAMLGAKVTAGETALKLMGGRAGEVQAFASGIAAEFGNIEEVSWAVSAQFAKISAFTGLSGENAAKLAKSIQIIQGGSLETSLNMIETYENIARTAGVMPKLVLEDIANSTETFARFAKDGGKNIAVAAAQAAKLGLNLDTVAGIADSLLDIEGSIEKQMEAQLLTGKQLNLDKAREHALMGDIDKLQGEILNQVGSQAEFEAMNVIQRKAMADAIGVSVADLGKMVAGEKTSAEVAAEKQKAEGEHMDMMKAMMIAQTGILTTQTMLMSGMVRRSLASAVGFIFQSFAKYPFGLGIPLALGAIGGMYALANRAPKLETGGEVVKSGMAEVHKGEVFSGTKNEMGFGNGSNEELKGIRAAITSLISAVVSGNDKVKNEIANIKMT